jgi:hypothetical protein
MPSASGMAMPAATRVAAIAAISAAPNGRDAPPLPTVVVSGLTKSFSPWKSYSTGVFSRAKTDR